MGEADPAAVELHDSRVRGLVDVLQSLLRDRALEQLERRLGESGREEQRLAGALGESRQPGEEELPKVLRDRQRLAGLDVVIRVAQGASQLESEERPSSGGLVHAQQQRTPEREVETCPAQLVDRRDRHRAERQARELRRDRLGYIRGRRHVRGDPHRREQADGSRVEAARGEREHECGGPVQPLQVVDRDDDRAVDRQHAQRAEKGRGHRPLVGWCAAGVRQEQRDLERTPLRRRQRREDLVERVAEKVAQARERELHLGATRAGGEDARYPRPRARSTDSCHSLVFPMPGSPSMKSALRASFEALQEAVDDRELVDSADERVGRDHVAFTSEHLPRASDKQQRQRRSHV